jgi:hypothetical protein
MTHPETALARMQVVAQAAIRSANGGVGFAYYPAPGSISGTPNLLLFWGESGIDYGPSEQVWMVQVKGQLLAALRNKLPTDIAKADPLVVPLVDAFAAGTDGYNLATNATGNLVDFCRVERVIPSLIVEFPSGSGAFYYGCEIYWRMKIRRFAGEA